MKCPNCGGNGKYKNGFGKIGVCYYCLGTGKVNDKGERNMTNEEWRKTCSAEEFAEFLCYVGFENETIVRRFKSEWMEWLKQPHPKE